jgi:hypothetical protein
MTGNYRPSADTEEATSAAPSAGWSKRRFHDGVNLIQLMPSSLFPPLRCVQAACLPRALKVGEATFPPVSRRCESGLALPCAPPSL